MTANTYGRQVVIPLTNKSGGQVIAGDVVVIDTTNSDAFTTSTAGAVTITIGIAQATIASNAAGPVLMSGYAALVNVNASVTRGNYGKTHTVAKQATDAGAARVSGTFCQFLTGGTTPDAMVYPVDLAGAALTNPMSHVGALIYGGSAGAPTELVVGSSGNVLRTDGTNPSWGAGTGLLLDYALAADITNQAITALSFFDLFANQNFTKAYTNSLIEVIVRGYGFFNDAATDAPVFRVNVDSAGTPVLKYLGSGIDYGGTTARRQNAVAGGSVFISGLSAATHTIKLQITTVSANNHLYCRATSGPPSGSEFLNVQVIEHL